jgi:hypothetical protein
MEFDESAWLITQPFVEGRHAKTDEEIRRADLLLHRRGIRWLFDLSRRNVLITPSGDPVIVDFIVNTWARDRLDSARTPRRSRRTFKIGR